LNNSFLSRYSSNVGIIWLLKRDVPFSFWEYPDSKKINIFPVLDVVMESSKIPYYTDGEYVREKLSQEILRS